MKFGDKIPVEPLSSSAWTRIEAETFAALEHGVGLRPQRAAVRSSRWATFAFGTLAAVQVAAAVTFMLTRGDARKHDALSSSRLVAGEHATDWMLGDVSFHLE